METQRTLTVSQLNFYAKNLLDADEILSSILLVGEISNFKYHSPSGHMYFTLKDEKSSISAAMFKQDNIKLRFQPKDGMKVLVSGSASVYYKNGLFQVYITSMEEYGAGEMALKLEELKNKLSKKGYFDPSIKKQIPKFPNKIGLISGGKSAAIADMIRILKERYPVIKLIQKNVLVQGDNAPKELANAVNEFSSDNNVDLIIIGRGGGSIEDLWAFNSEILADAIFNCKIPIISAVGHETDTTICDFVSDVRAATPSHAAELAVPNKIDLISYLDSQEQYLYSLVDSIIKQKSSYLDNNYRILQAYSPFEKIRQQKEELRNRNIQIQNIINTKLEITINDFQYLLNRIEALNPISVLKRGYSVTTKNNRNVNSIKEIALGDTLDIKLSDGSIKTIVETISEG